MKKNNHDLLIDLNKNYKDFGDFYGENKTIIYKSIIDVFEKFKTTKKKNLKLIVKAMISDLDFETEFCYSINEKIVLTRDLIPYFESVEDFETCARIMDLNKELSSI
jgi:hypothetical protein